ncbi:hypothetical protein H0H92_007099, partial [Tricholoma furcatifolium]
MGRGPRYKLVQYKSKTPYPASGSVSARKVTQHVEHNCYTSTQGMATLSTSFLTKEVIVPAREERPQTDPRTAKLDEQAEIAYELAYLHHLDERDEEGPKRRPVPSVNGIGNDDPMRMWLPHREAFLQELINIDGRGDRPKGACQDCRHLPAGEARFECIDCIGRGLRCLGCLLERHGESPWHRVQDRYQAFLLMIRQWRHLKMLKRGARGHETNGIATTPLGSCAVECPACPQPDKNMPEDWKNTPEDKKLKRKDVSSDQVDPDLGQGFAYFVQEAPYKAHLERHQSEVEPKSNCSRHNAVNLANTKIDRGLAATGVATVECMRHDMKRPCSVGDLQVGER